MVKAYWRCNGGDYFSTKACPFDGWTSPEIDELFQAVETLKTRKIPVSIGVLRDLAVSEKAIQRCIVVEFGNDAAVFEAMSPGYYVIEGKSYKLHEVGSVFK